MKTIVIIALAAALAGGATSRAKFRPACGAAGYAYAGVIGPSGAAAVRATIDVVAEPRVGGAGHVGAWVGVSRPDAGKWFQVGIGAVAGTSSASRFIYVETQSEGYTLSIIRAGVRAGARVRVSVVEEAHRPGWWRAFVDGKPVERKHYLAGSHGRWSSCATAENLGPGCNSYRYRFTSVQIAGARRAWVSMHPSDVLSDGSNHVTARTGDGFTASGD